MVPAEPSRICKCHHAQRKWPPDGKDCKGHSRTMEQSGKSTLALKSMQHRGLCLFLSQKALQGCTLWHPYRGSTIDQTIEVASPNCERTCGISQKLHFSMKATRIPFVFRRVATGHALERKISVTCRYFEERQEWDDANHTTKIVQIVI